MIENNPKSFRNCFIDFQIDKNVKEATLEFAVSSSLTSQLDLFLESFLLITNSVSSAIPPDIFQFNRLINEDHAQVTPENIVKFEIIPFLISLLDMSTPPQIISASLNTINMLAYYSDDLLNRLNLYNISDLMPLIFTYPNIDVQTHISILFANVTDYDRVPSEIIGYNATKFFDQSIQWAACHPSQKCRKECLRFHSNIVVGANLNMILIQQLTRFQFSMLVCEDISLISFAAWNIGRIIQYYDLRVDPKDVFIHMWNLIDTKAAIPLLRLALEAGNNNDGEFPKDIPINWDILLNKMRSEEKEIVSLSCRIAQYLMNGGIILINDAISVGILDVVGLVLSDGPYKAKIASSMVIQNILMQGSKEQKKFLLLHNCILQCLKFIEGVETDKAVSCLISMKAALQDIIQTDPSFSQLFKQNVPFQLFANLTNHANENIYNCSNSIIELLNS